VNDDPRATLVDASVLLDVLTEDATWFDWSATALADAADAGSLVINAVIYAEASVRFSRIEELEAVLPADAFERRPIPYPAAFLAGKCFVAYRSRGGARRSPLPDFFIGAHAAVDGMRLLTRDAARYRTYFPGLAIVAP
jgi:predicted nucleic acid-binding protein